MSLSRALRPAVLLLLGSLVMAESGRALAQNSATQEDAATTTPGLPTSPSGAAPVDAPSPAVAAPTAPVSSPAAGASQPEPPKPAPTPVEVAETWAEGYTLPDAPALTLLNADSSKIQEPGSLEELGVDLLDGFTAQGGIQSGLALKVSGRAFGVGKDFVDYRRSDWIRFLARISLSLATVKDSATPTTTFGSVGLRLVFLDGSDALVDSGYLDWVRQAKVLCPTPLDADGDADHQTCLKALPKLAPPPWNADGVALASATSAAFANGELKQATWADTAVWLTGTKGINASPEFGLQLSAAGEFRHLDSAHKDVGAGALRIRGGSSFLRGALEASYASDSPTDPKNRKGKLLFGLDVKLTKGTWLNANLGGSYNFTGSPFSVFSIASLKYAFADSPSVPGP